MKRVIIESFSEMDELDLIVKGTEYAKIENALSFKWALHVSKSFFNIHIDSHVSSKSGYVDFFIDG